MIVIAEKPGQLGNMLFLFSHFIARSIESNFTVANLAFDDYAHHFPLTRADLFARFPARKSLISGNRFRRRLLFRASNLSGRVLSKLGWNFSFLQAITLRDWLTEFNLGSDDFLKRLRPRQIIIARGWLFRDEPSVKKHSATLKELFRPDQSKEKNIDELIARARQNTDVLIGVHIRQGIIQFANTRKYFYSGPEYVLVMEELAALFAGKRVSFLICSDWPQDPNLFSRFKVTFGTGDLIEDMYAFARCDYLIGPPSTFTMWASFYGDVPLNVIRSRDQKQRLEDFSLNLDAPVNDPPSTRAPEAASV